jgi:4-amino-4-deoxy-L-arabinose transferase-like glycosyltransferase
VTGVEDATLALVLALVLNLFMAVQIRARAGPDGGFLVRVYWWTLALRYALAITLNVYANSMSFAAMFWGDSTTYDSGGYGLALYWQNEAFGRPASTNVVGRYGYYYFVGGIYYIFGRNQLLVQFLNGTIGALTAVVMFTLANRLFGTLVARRVALLTAFFPGMVFWSGGMYKDPAILFCIVVAMYAVVRLREEVSLTMLLLFVAAVLALVTLRFYIAYFVIFATVASFVFLQRGSFVKRLLSYALVVGALGAAFTVVLREEALEEQSSFATLERLQATRTDQAIQGQSAFGREYNVSTPQGAIVALPVGLVYLLFAPFPWAVAGTRQALVLPEMLVWYGLMPAFAAGLLHSVRKRLGDVLPILVFAASLTLAYALMQGNIGTAYRQRTQITVFFFLFIGVGLVERAKKRELARSKFLVQRPGHGFVPVKRSQGHGN